jgi:hypothetical protein
MPEMRQPQTSTDLRQFLRQDLEKELARSSTVIQSTGPSLDGEYPNRWGRRICALFLTLCLGLVGIACQHSPEVLLEPDKTTKTFEANEKVVMKAISRVLKDRGFGEATIQADKGRLETDYVVQEDWRTKVIASVKKVSRKESEVTLSIITEEKSSSSWQLKKLMGKSQYEKFFGEIDLQIYREMANPE